MDSNKKSSFFDRLGDEIIEVFSWGKKTPDQPIRMNPEAASYGAGEYRTIGGYSYNGEKNLGEIGPVKGYNVDYATLRQRSNDMYLDSELAQIAIKKYVSWTIGKGLRLQAEPEKLVLEQEGIKLDWEKWTKLIEARFRVFSRSREIDFSGMNSLNRLQATAFKNCKIGGDVLVVLRYIRGQIKIQLIDGVHVVNPVGYGNIFAQKTEDGNTILHGVEMDSSGQHVAYHIRKPGIGFETQRIAARGRRSGMLMAYLVYGSQYRIDSIRGLPILSVIMETAKKLERYKEAAVGSAEERQKVAYFMEHGIGSTGENALAQQTMKAYNTNRDLAGGALPTDSAGNAVADSIAATTNKMTFNLPIDSTMKELTSKNEMQFGDFYGKNTDVIFAAVELPPNVAMSKYDSNFSASRAALKDWGNTLDVNRDDFSFQFMQPIYDLFLETEVKKFKVQAPGYIAAKSSGDMMILESYRKTRFTGAPVPHIDPVKEVEAERLKLGEAGASIPLTTVERATEALGEGDSESNIEQYASELEKSKKLGIKMEEPPVPGGAPAPAKKKPAKKS